jgi:hypothetical protein
VSSDGRFENLVDDYPFGQKPRWPAIRRTFRNGQVHWYDTPGRCPRDSDLIAADGVLAFELGIVTANLTREGFPFGYAKRLTYLAGRWPLLRNQLERLHEHDLALKKGKSSGFEERCVNAILYEVATIRDSGQADWLNRGLRTGAIFAETSHLVVAKDPLLTLVHNVSTRTWEHEDLIRQVAERAHWIVTGGKTRQCVQLNHIAAMVEFLDVKEVFIDEAICFLPTSRRIAPSKKQKRGRPADPEVSKLDDQIVAIYQELKPQHNTRTDGSLYQRVIDKINSLHPGRYDKQDLTVKKVGNAISKWNRRLRKATTK